MPVHNALIVGGAWDSGDEDQDFYDVIVTVDDVSVTVQPYRTGEELLERVVFDREEWAAIVAFVDSQPSSSGGK